MGLKPALLLDRPLTALLVFATQPNSGRRKFYGRRAYSGIDSLPVVDRGNGIQTTPLITKELGSKHIATGITRFPVGAKVPMHSHNCDEQVTILGEADAEIDGQSHRRLTLTTRRWFQPTNRTVSSTWHDAAGDPLDLYFQRGDPYLRRNRRNGRASVRAGSGEPLAPKGK